MSSQFRGTCAGRVFGPGARGALPLLPLLAACILALSGCAHSPTSAAANAQIQAQTKAAEEAKPPLQRGEEAAARGDYAAAIAFYRKAHNDNPGMLAPLLHLGGAQVAIGDYAGAYESYRQAQALSADDPEAAFRLGELMLVGHSPQAAIDQFNIALKSRKNDPALYSALGVAYSMMGKYDLAIRTDQAGLSIVPGHMGLKNNLGLAQFLAGDYDGAVKTLSDLAANPAAKPRYRQNLAFIYAVHGDYQHAREIAGHGVDLAALKSELDLYRADQQANQPGDDTRAAAQVLMGIHFSGDPGAAPAPIQNTNSAAPAGPQTSQAPAQPAYIGGPR